MKKLNISLYLLCLTSIFPFISSGQENCEGSFTEYLLNSNNIRASFFPRGNKFTSGNGPGFLVPYPLPQKVSTIFASAPWIGGFDDAGNPRGGYETHPNNNSRDFSVGPLTSIGTQFPDTVCGHFDKVWTVFAEDILKHKKDFEEDFILDDTIPAIFGWPAIGNKFFKRFNGFSLPYTGNQGLAPYHDNNQDQIYNPGDGDYPIVYPSSSWPVIPDQIMWMVFNDVVLSDSATERTPARFEFQLTAFAFHCQDNEILNNTVFNSYKIISRSVLSLDSVFFGMWTDYDLGCALDDFVGSDSLRSTEFVYNGDELDGDVGFDCSTGSDTYSGNIPPIQSMTYLSHPMHSFIIYNSNADTPVERYRLLNGNWGDGTPIRPEGDGYDEDPVLNPTRFIYNGDPRDSSSWAATNVFEEGKEVQTVSSVFLGRLDPGSVEIVDLAYTFHNDTTADYLGQMTSMYENIDSLRNIDLFWGEPCTRFPLCLDNDCVWPGDFDKNGIADHRDYLTWAVLNGSTGAERNGLVSWRGHYGEDWNKEIHMINAKYADGDGNGVVELNDIEINNQNFLLTNDAYNEEATYPPGPEIVLTSMPTFDSEGRIRNFKVSTGRVLPDILGVTFEVEFDTSLLRLVTMLPFWPADSNKLTYISGYAPSEYFKVSYVQTDNTGITIDSNITILRALPSSFSLKTGLPIPDSTVIRLRNLKGIDPEGNDLHLGSYELIVYKEGFTGVSNIEKNDLVIYPNPTDGSIFIETDLETDLLIFNMQGQLVRKISKIEIHHPVDLSSLLPGIYLLEETQTGKTFKLIKI